MANGRTILPDLPEATDAQMTDGALATVWTQEQSSSSGFVTKKSPLSKLANYVLNKYSALQLAGITQTVKSAIDSIMDGFGHLVDYVIGDTPMGTTADTITGAIAEHEGDITSLNNNLTNYIVANNYTFPSAVSIGASNTYTNTDVDVSSAVPTGYTPVFAFCRATGENSISCYQCGMYNIANKKAVIQLRNISASSLNVTPVITVVSVKS